jgi:hypothetical protein
VKLSEQVASLEQKLESLEGEVSLLRHQAMVRRKVLVGDLWRCTRVLPWRILRVERVEPERNRVIFADDGGHTLSQLEVGNHWELVGRPFADEPHYVFPDGRRGLL